MTLLRLSTKLAGRARHVATTPRMSCRQRHLATQALFFAESSSHQSSFSIPILLGTGLTLMTTGYFLFQHSVASPVQCEQVKHGESVSFQVTAALEKNDEIQRIRCAQILHDLHELAREQTKLKRKETVRNMWKFVKRRSGLGSSAASSNDAEEEEEEEVVRRRTTKKGELSLRNVDLEHLSHERALELIGRLDRGERFNKDSLEELLDASEHFLRKDSTLVNLRDSTDNIFVVGDLHGSLYALQHALEVIGPIGGMDRRTVVFDGDFVDRGSESLEVICILLLLKLAYPQHVYLLRGNHEDILVASAYGFHDELIEKYGEKAMDTIWDKVNAVFCALPLGAVTKNAAILHGGIPSKEFRLKDLETISTDERCAIRTIISEGLSEVGKIVQGVLWSDPSPRDGIRPNTARTIGVFFGPDVARDFLIEHKLKYLIRGHEVAENGISSVTLDDDHSVVTVFSQPAYPDGLGTNKGAVLELDTDGNYRTVAFTHCDPPVTCPKGIKANNDRVLADLRSLLDSRIGKVEEAFRAMAPNGMISTYQWTKIMEEKLELPGAPWPSLLPSLVPKSARRKEGYIDWRIFIKTRGDGTDRIIQNLRANHRMLMTVYNFLDVNGDGTINKEEFKEGIALLNKRLPEDRRLHADELFERMDLKHNGEVDLEEFSQVFNSVP